jgi:hypothetical protein
MAGFDADGLGPLTHEVSKYYVQLLTERRNIESSICTSLDYLTSLHPLTTVRQQRSRTASSSFLRCRRRMIALSGNSSATRLHSTDMQRGRAGRTRIPINDGRLPQLTVQPLCYTYRQTAVFGNVPCRQGPVRRYVPHAVTAAEVSVGYSVRWQELRGQF